MLLFPFQSNTCHWRAGSRPWNAGVWIRRECDDCGVELAHPSVVASVADAAGRDPNNPKDWLDEDYVRARKMVVCTRYIRAMNSSHDNYRAHVRNQFIDGADVYPNNLHEAYNKSQRWNGESTQSTPIISDGLAYAATGQQQPQEEGTRREPRGPQCWGCGEYGHIRTDCPKSDNEEHGNVSMLLGSSNTGFMFVAGPDTTIPNHWIILDTGATIDVFKDARLLTNIYQSETKMNIHGYGDGAASTTMRGTLPNHGEVWFDPNSRVNILSFSLAKKKYKVTMKNDNIGEYFQLTKPDGSGYRFREHACGLYYIDTHNPDSFILDPDYVYDEQYEHVLQVMGQELEGIVMVNTVAANKNNYSDEDYSRAVLARKLYIITNRPSIKDFVRFIKTGKIRNCPIGVADVMRAEAIFGPDVGTLKGKNVRQNPHRVRDVVTPIPPHIAQEYKSLTICGDVMYANNQPMIITVTRKIKIGTVEELLSRQDKHKIEHFKQLCRMMAASGYRVQVALMDREFESLRAELANIGITLNTTGEDEHVGDIERYIRTIKERVRAIWNSLPFVQIPIRLVIEMVKASVFWWNAFPVQSGISKHLSPRAIITGREIIDYDRHCQYEFGEYVQTHEKTSNDMTPRTIGALATRPTGNAQGTWHFLSLTTGRIISRNYATKVPMPDLVVDQIHRMARRQKMKKGILFTNRNNEPFHHEAEPFDDEESPHDEDDGDYYSGQRYEYEYADNEAEYYEGEDDEYVVNEDDEYVLDEDDEYYSEEDDTYQQDSASEDSEWRDSNYDVEEHYQLVSIEEIDDDVPEDYDVYAEYDDSGSTANYEAPENQGVIPEETGVSLENQGVSLINENQGVRPRETEVILENQGVSHINEEIVPTDRIINDIKEEVEVSNDNHVSTKSMNMGNAEVEDMDEKYGRRQREGLRARKPRDYSHLFHVVGHVFNTGESTLDQKTTGAHIATPQVNMKKGIKMFGDAGRAAIRKEAKQLHDVNAVKPKHKKQLTRDQLKMALEYLMFLKRKRCGRIKARGCADGRPQRAYIPRDEATSPTAATQSVILTAVIDALERRYVTYVDIPGAFLQAFNDDETYVVIRGEMVDQLVAVDPELYEPYVIYERGEKCLYLQAVMALYGTLKAARLFWEMLSKVLTEDWGFTINAYDACVANKIINGKQMTIVWHVDDMKISHEDPEVIKQFINDQLKPRFGKTSPLTVSDEVREEYIGMTFDHTHDGKIEVSMHDYVEMMTQELPQDFIGKARTPAANHLFKIRDEAECVPLDEKKKATFVRLVMQALYLSQRARPDIRTAVSFLSTRLQRPDKDDWHKLGRMIKYLQATPDLSLMLESDGTGKIYWWVDASFAVHMDMKGHTGSCMSLGKGCIYCDARKQKINTRSSTEAEQVGVYDTLPQIEWTARFLKDQGLVVDTSMLYQDNKSAILLQKNGKLSSSKRTRHMDQRYFYIKDKVDSGEVTIEHCPTEEMIADFGSKPLQGRLFYYLRDAIMNIDPNSPYHSSNQRSVLRLNETTHGQDEPGNDSSNSENNISHGNDLNNSENNTSHELKIRTYADVVKE